MVLTTALMCLSLNVYFESRSETTIGQAAIAHVVLNRKKDKNWKDLSVCQIVFQKKQFSWVNSRAKRDKQGNYKLYFKKGDFLEPGAFTDAQNIAQLVLSGKIKDPTKGAKYFHERNARPSWRHRFKKVARIGRHEFYR